MKRAAPEYVVVSDDDSDDEKADGDDVRPIDPPSGPKGESPSDPTADPPGGQTSRRSAKRWRAAQLKEKRGELLAQLGRPLDEYDQLDNTADLERLVAEKRDDLLRNVPHLAPHVDVSVFGEQQTYNGGPTLLARGGRIADLPLCLLEHMRDRVRGAQVKEQRGALIRGDSLDDSERDSRRQVQKDEETARWFVCRLPAVLRDLVRLFAMHPAWGAEALDAQLQLRKRCAQLYVHVAWQHFEEAVVAAAPSKAAARKAISSRFPQHKSFRALQYEVATESPCRQCMQAVAEGWEVNGLGWGGSSWRATRWTCLGCFTHYQMLNDGYPCYTRPDGSDSRHWATVRPGKPLHYDCPIC